MDKNDDLKQEVQLQLNRVRDALVRASGIKGFYEYLTEKEEAKRATWAKAVIDAKVEAILTSSENEMHEQWSAAMEAFEKAREAAKARIERVELDNEKLNQAVKFINEMDPELVDEKAKSINEQFAGDQNAFEVLERVYSKRGLNRPGMLGSYMYSDFDHEWNRARAALSESLQLKGYPNAAGQAMTKVARFEGVDFNPVIDKRSVNSPEQLQNMSTDDINNNWEEISKYLENL